MTTTDHVQQGDDKIINDRNKALYFATWLIILKRYQYVTKLNEVNLHQEIFPVCILYYHFWLIVQTSTWIITVFFVTYSGIEGVQRYVISWYCKERNSLP